MNSGVKRQGGYLGYGMMLGFYQFSSALLTTLISVYLLDSGYRHGQISTMVSLAYFTAMVFQPVIGLLQKRYGVRGVDLALLCAAAAAGVCFSRARSFLLIAGLYSVMFMVINCLAQIGRAHV